MLFEIKVYEQKFICTLNIVRSNEINKKRVHLCPWCQIWERLSPLKEILESTSKTLIFSPSSRWLLNIFEFRLSPQKRSRKNL